MMVGGGSTTPTMVERFLKLAGGKDARILVLPFMREEPEVTGPGSVELLKENGATRVSLATQVPKSLDDKRMLSRQILNSDGLWLPGGNQNLFVERLGLEWCQKVVLAAHQRGIAIFGTSAGAMLMSDPMIGGNVSAGVPLRARGLGLVPFVVDTHYRERDRQPRLRYAVDEWGSPKGVGLSEGEWLVWNGSTMDWSGKPEWIQGLVSPISSSSTTSWSRRQASIR